MNQTDSMLDPTGSRRMRPAQTWWAGRSWRADRVGQYVDSGLLWRWRSLVSNFIQTPSVNERILPETSRPLKDDSTPKHSGANGERHARFAMLPR
jgi:hypothetical protein